MADNPPQRAVGHLDVARTIATFITMRDALATTEWRESAAWNLEYAAGPAMDALFRGGVPRPQLVIQDSGVGQGLGAVFNPVTWTVTAPRNLYGVQAVSVDVLRLRAAQHYHEARHAEQFFLAARMIAGIRQMSRNARQMNVQQAIKPEIWAAAQQAATEPSAGESRLINAWIDEYNRRFDVMKALESAMALLVQLRGQIDTDQALVTAGFADAQEREQRSRSLQLHTSQAGVRRQACLDAWEAYLGLAVEVDAYRVSAQVGAAAPDPEEIYGRLVGTPLSTLRTAVTAASRALDQRQQQQAQAAAVQAPAAQPQAQPQPQPQPQAAAVLDIDEDAPEPDAHIYEPPGEAEEAEP